MICTFLLFSSVYLFIPFSSVYGLEFKYHSNEELETELVRFVKDTSSNHLLKVEKYTIGSTRKGNNISVVSITSVKTLSDSTIPNIKLIGNVHGYEALSREILLQFLYFLRDNYRINYDVGRLLNTTKIHVLPAMNPDGYMPSEMGCYPGFQPEKRENGDDTLAVDLDRNFPILFQQNQAPEAEETKAIVRWMNNIPFVLSLALHGNDMVVSYPYDRVRNPKTGVRLPEETPDNDVFVYLSEVYSKSHPYMSNFTDDPEQYNHDFDDMLRCNRYIGGTVNGVFRHNRTFGVFGSMKDYNYEAHGCMEVSADISCCPYPYESEIAEYWKENRNAILKYCLEANRGIVGQVRDGHTEEPIGNASLKIKGRDIVFRSRMSSGLFWKLLLDGEYSLEVSADGYVPQEITFSLKQRLANFPKLYNLGRIYLWNETLSTVSTTKPATTTIRRFLKLQRKTMQIITTVQEPKMKEYECITSGAKNLNYLIIFVLVEVFCFLFYSI